MNFARWTTRLPTEHTRPYGVEELHYVFFEPEGWPGKGTTIGLNIPECELHFSFVAPDDQPVVFINRPGKKNPNVKKWTHNACQLAAEYRAVLMFNCDTAEQAEQAARRAKKWLPPHYQRMALERMLSDPKDRARANLS